MFTISWRVAEAAHATVRRLGNPIQVPLSDGKKSASVKVEAQEREEVTTPLGKFKAIRYEVFMFNDVLINKKARCTFG